MISIYVHLWFEYIFLGFGNTLRLFIKLNVHYIDHGIIAYAFVCMKLDYIGGLSNKILIGSVDITFRKF